MLALQPGDSRCTLGWLCPVMRGRPVRLCVVWFLLALAGCDFAYEDSASVPAQPNYDDHVRPIFEHHFLVCHSLPSDRGAPTYFTLQQYDDVSAAIDGANTMSYDVQTQISENRMPPAAEWGDGLGANDKQIIELWVNNGAPENAAEAAAHAQNSNSGL
jgi:hypothetical protein